MSPFDGQRPLRAPKTAELLARHFRRLIIRGELPEGAGLPTEGELMQEFGVSRPTLREAFRILEMEGLISVRRGSRGGGRVEVPSAEATARYAGLLLQYRRATITDLNAAWAVVEPAAVRMVAARRDRARSADLLEAELERGSARQAGQPRSPFHQLLVELTRNQTLTFLATVLELIQEAAIQTPGLSEAADTARTGVSDRRAHARLIELIRAGEETEAERLWRRHLHSTRSCLEPTPADPDAPLDVVG